MKNSIIKTLFAALVAINFATPSQAGTWWPWPRKTQVKTVELAIPVSNGGLVSVTIPSKTAAPRRGGGGHRRAQDSAIIQREDERIAADLERHF